MGFNLVIYSGHLINLISDGKGQILKKAHDFIMCLLNLDVIAFNQGLKKSLYFNAKICCRFSDDKGVHGVRVVCELIHAQNASHIQLVLRQRDA